MEDRKRRKLDPRCTIPDLASKGPDSDSSISVPAENEQENGLPNQNKTGEEIVLLDAFSKPIYTIGVWLFPDEEENAHVSVAILLFSGTDKQNQIEVNVVDSGGYLEYAVRWPSMMTDANEMHRKWLKNSVEEQRLQFYHPMITCFKQYVARLRRRESTVRSTARIPLPFDVETCFEYYLPKSVSSSARILYGHLHAPANQQPRAVKEEDIQFE